MELSRMSSDTPSLSVSVLSRVSCPPSNPFVYSSPLSPSHPLKEITKQDSCHLCRFRQDQLIVRPTRTCPCRCEWRWNDALNPLKVKPKHRDRPTVAGCREDHSSFFSPKFQHNWVMWHIVHLQFGHLSDLSFPSQTSVEPLCTLIIQKKLSIYRKQHI